MSIPLDRSEMSGVFLGKKDYMWAGLLVLYCINFLNIGYYVPLILSPFLLGYLLKGRFSPSFMLSIYVMFSFNVIYASYLFAYNFGATSSILGKVIYPILFFILGYLVVKGDNQIKRTFGYLLLIISSSTLFGLLCVLKTISIFGSMEIARSSVGRAAINIWGNNELSATFLNLSLAFGLSVLSAIFVKEKGNGKLIKPILLTCFIISTICVIQLGNRTGLVIIIASFLVSFLFSQKISYRKIFSLLPLVFMIIVLKWLVNSNIGGLGLSWYNSFLYNRFFANSLTEDIRIPTWNAAFWGIFENPFGNKQTIMPLSTAHNLWLDVGYEAGIVPFLLLVLLTILAIHSLLIFIKRPFPVLLKSLIVGLYTSFFISFFSEPIMLGGVAYFTLFCFIFGMVHRLNYENRKPNT